MLSSDFTKKFKAVYSKTKFVQLKRLSAIKWDWRNSFLAITLEYVSFFTKVGTNKINLSKYTSKYFRHLILFILYITPLSVINYYQDVICVFLIKLHSWNYFFLIYYFYILLTYLQIQKNWKISYTRKDNRLINYLLLRTRKYISN